MHNYQNITKEELIIAYERLQELNNFLVSSRKMEDKYDSEEEKLQHKDLQFRKLSANVPDLIFQFTRRTDGSYFVPIASEGIINIFGCSPEDVLNDFTPIARVIYPEDAERVINDIEYSANHLTYFTCEFRVQLPGKEIQWILSNSTPEKLPDGSVTWYGFNANITEQKNAEEKLKKAALLLKSSIESPKDIIILSIDKNYNYLYFNECHRLAMLYAYGQEVKIGMNLLACITSEEDKIKAKINYDKALNGESHITIEVYGDIEKAYYETRYNPIFNEKSEIIGTTAFSANITDRKQTEKDLIESEYRFRKLYEDGANGMVMVSKDFKFLKANRSFCQMVGYREEELQQLTFLDITHPDDKDKDIPQVKKMITGEIDVYRTEKRYLNKNGQTIWTQLTISTFYDLNGQFLYNLAIIINITERKNAELALWESESRFRQAVMGAPFPIMIHTDDGQVVTINNPWTQLTGYEHSDIPTIADWTRKAYGNQMNLVLADIDKLFTLDGPKAEGEYTITTSSGDSRIWDFSSAPIGALLDGRRLVISMAMDVTERKNAELDLIRMSQIMKNSQEIAHLGSFEYVAANQTTIWSEEEYNIFGLDPNGPSPDYNVMLEKYIHPDDVKLLHNSFMTAMQNKSVYELEHRIVRPDGTIRWVYDKANPEFDELGTLVRYVGATLDITERKNATEEITRQLEELRRWHQVTLGREGRILELKREVNDLLHQRGEALRYGSNIPENTAGEKV